MDQNNNATTHVLNTLMVWLTCFTVALVCIPWEAISSELASRVDNCRSYLYLAIIFELSNFVAQFCVKTYSYIRNSNKQKNLARNLSLEVSSMDFSERALLREFVLQRRSELNLPTEEPTVSRLIESGILEIVSTVDEKGKSLCAISRQARPLITYRVLGLSASGMSSEQITQIMSERPTYAKPVIKMRRVYRSGDFKAA